MTSRHLLPAKPIADPSFIPAGGDLLHQKTGTRKTNSPDYSTLQQGKFASVPSPPTIGGETSRMQVPASVDGVLASSGIPLELPLRVELSKRFSHDFSSVRVHTSRKAGQSAKDVNARAYTIGHNIVFGEGRYAPDTFEGRKLLAHELTHVVQQTRGVGGPFNGTEGLENEAKDVASKISNNASKVNVFESAKVHLARELESEVPLELRKLLSPQDIAKLKAFSSADFDQSIIALQGIFNKTKGFTLEGYTQKTQDTRQAAGELNIFLETIRDPEVNAVKVIPSSSDGRSPDLYARFNTPDSAGKFERRIENRNITLTSADVRPDARLTSNGRVAPRIEKVEVEPNKYVVVLPTTKELTYSQIKEAIRDKITSKIDKKTGQLKPTQLDAQNANTLVNGRQMEVGGDVAIIVHGHGEVDKKLLDKVIEDLNGDSGPIRKSSVRRILISANDATEQGGGRKIFEYIMRNDTFSSQVREPHYKQSASLIPPPTSLTPELEVLGTLSDDTVAATAKQSTSSASAEKRIVKSLADSGEKNVATVAAGSMVSAATRNTEKRLASSLAPGIGIAFSLPDIWKGAEDIRHGNIVLGVGTIAVAGVDIASDFLHFTDIVTEGGGTALALTIQGWTTAMQMGFERGRISQRSRELVSYIKSHNGALPPRADLMSYYGLNDEDILILEGDIWKAKQGPRITAAMVRDETLRLIKSLDNATKERQLSAEEEKEIRVETEQLRLILAKFEEQVVIEEKRRAEEDKRAEIQRNKAKVNALILESRSRQSALAPSPGRSAAETLSLNTIRNRELKPSPQADPLGLFGVRTNSVTGMSALDRADAVAAMLFMEKDALLHKAEVVQRTFSSEVASAYRTELRLWLGKLEKLIQAWEASGGREWNGVKRMKELNDLVHNGLRNALMLDTL